MKEYLNYHDIVLYYHKCNIFDNIENIIAILDALVKTKMGNMVC